MTFVRDDHHADNALTALRRLLGEVHRTTAVTVLLATLVAACGSDNHPVIVIENDLAMPVTVVFVNADGQESSLVEAIPPGLQYSVDVFPTDSCTPGVLVARDSATGHEVARSPGPVCRPSRWVIQAPDPS